MANLQEKTLFTTIRVFKLLSNNKLIRLCNNYHTKICMELTLDEIKMLQGIADHVSQFHPLHTQTQALIQDHLLLYKQVQEIKVNWNLIAQQIGCGRDRLYHWYYETHMRRVNDLKISKVQRNQMQELIINGIKTRQIEQENYQQFVKQQVFGEKSVHRADFSMTYNNLLRTKPVKAALQQFKINLPTKRKQDGVESLQNDASSVSVSMSKSSTISQEFSQDSESKQRHQQQRQLIEQEFDNEQEQEKQQQTLQQQAQAQQIQSKQIFQQQKIQQQANLQQVAQQPAQDVIKTEGLNFDFLKDPIFQVSSSHLCYPNPNANVIQQQQQEQVIAQQKQIQPIEKLPYNQPQFQQQKKSSYEDGFMEFNNLFVSTEGLTDKLPNQSVEHQTSTIHLQKEKSKSRMLSESDKNRFMQENSHSEHESQDIDY